MISCYGNLLKGINVNSLKIIETGRDLKLIINGILKMIECKYLFLKLKKKTKEFHKIYSYLVPINI